MNFCRGDEGFCIHPERVLLDDACRHRGEAPRAAASFNHALQRTRLERRGCNRSVPWAGSLSLGRSPH